jgi:uncharacterized CHY-type Zn-finger protein
LIADYCYFHFRFSSFLISLSITLIITPFHAAAFAATPALPAITLPFRHYFAFDDATLRLIRDFDAIALRRHATIFARRHAIISICRCCHAMMSRRDYFITPFSPLMPLADSFFIRRCRRHYDDYFDIFIDAPILPCRC